LEVPLVFITFHYIRKFKKLLRASSVRRTEGITNTVMTKHLLEQEDRYIILKKKQSNYVFAALVLNFLLHVIEIVMFYADSQ
jgi:uncharacterized membrane protein YcgQ (UPF0703/DUF1980 family)